MKHFVSEGYPRPALNQDHQENLKIAKRKKMMAMMKISKQRERMQNTHEKRENYKGEITSIR